MVDSLSRSALGLMLFAATQAHALYDPTRPTDPVQYFGQGGSSAARQAWTLHSILRASDRRIAIINGRRVREGERIGSARVLRIDDSQVLLQTGTRRLTLRLLPHSIKVHP